MIDINLYTLSGIGLLSGILGAMLGIGGGVLIVPAFALLLHIPIHIAIGSSLVALVANSLTASYYYVKAQMTNIKIGLLLEAATVPGAIAGSLVVTFVSSYALSILFAIILVGIAASMVMPRPLGIQNPCNEPISGKRGDCILGPANRRANSYCDSASRATINYRVTRISWGLVASFFSGIISTVLGVGGGVIKVPVMTQLKAAG